MKQRSPKPLARWTATDDAGDLVEFRYRRAKRKGLRPFALELRRAGMPEGVWHCCAWVCGEREADWVLENFYESIFEGIERVG